MDPYNTGNPIGLGPRGHTYRKKRRIRGPLLTILALLLLSSGGWVAFQRIAAAKADTTYSVTSLAESPVVNMEKNRIERWNGVTKKVAYLTFEDGPTALTPAILDQLKKEQVHATFFLVGTEIDLYPDSVKRIVEEGHYPGLHIMTHSRETLYDSKKADTYIKEMHQVQKRIKQLTDKQPLLSRPPFGSSPYLTKSMAKDIAKANLRVWDWSIDSMDWYYKDSAKEVAKTVISRATEPFEIILLHEQPQAVRAIPAIVAGLKKKGYQFAVYDEDLHTPFNFAKHPEL